MLLSQQKADDYIEVDLELDELDLTSAESKATYAEIKDYVLEKFGLKVSNLYIFIHLSTVYEDAREYGEKYLPYILYAFKSSINHMRTFFKNEHFSNENEYRVVLKVPDGIIKC